MNRLPPIPHDKIGETFLWRDWLTKITSYMFNGTISTSATAGTAGALPATPAGYLSIVIDGVEKKVPYYNS